MRVATRTEARTGTRRAPWIRRVWASIFVALVMAAPLTGLTPVASEAADRPVVRQQRERAVRIQRQRQRVQRQLERRGEGAQERLDGPAHEVEGLNAAARVDLVERARAELDAWAADANAEGAPLVLTQPERDALQAQLATLDPEQRRRLRDRARALRNRSPEERARLRRHLQRFLEASPEARASLRERAERFWALTPEEQQALREQWVEWAELPVDERERALGALLDPEP